MTGPEGTDTECEDPWATVSLTKAPASPATPPASLVEVSATARHDAWTASELKTLAAMFRRDHAIPEIAGALGRSLAATRTRIDALGLRRNSRRPWEADEDAEVRARYGAEPVADLARDIGRSPASVYARACQIGCADFRAPPWSDWEIDALTRMISGGRPYADAARALGRGLPGVSSKASEIGLRSPNARTHWSAEETALLIRLATEEALTSREIASRLDEAGHTRSRLAVKQRLMELGIDRDAPSPWSEAEDAILKAGYAAGLDRKTIAARLPGRTRSSVHWRAQALDLRHPRPNGARQGTPWTPDEHARLRQLYGTCKVSDIAERIGRPVRAVYTEAWRLGLAGDYRRRWTPEEDAELLTCTGSLKALSAARGWNYQSASKRRKRLRAATGG